MSAARVLCGTELLLGLGQWKQWLQLSAGCHGAAIMWRGCVRRKFGANAVQSVSVPPLQPRSLTHPADRLWQRWSSAAWWISGGIWRLCWGSSQSYHPPRGLLEPGDKKNPLFKHKNTLFKALDCLINHLSLQGHHAGYSHRDLNLFYGEANECSRRRPGTTGMLLGWRLQSHPGQADLFAVSYCCLFPLLSSDWPLRTWRWTVGMNLQPLLLPTCLFSFIW